MSQRTALTTGVNADCDTGTCPTDAQSSQAAAAAQAEDPTDWTTFLPPVDASLGHRLGPSVVIEVCVDGRYVLRRSVPMLFPDLLSVTCSSATDVDGCIEPRGYRRSFCSHLKTNQHKPPQTAIHRRAAVQAASMPQEQQA